MKYNEWVLMTLLLIFVVGTALLLFGSLLEWKRLSKILDTSPENLAFLGVKILGIFFLFMAHVAHLYLYSRDNITLYSYGY